MASATSATATATSATAPQTSSQEVSASVSEVAATEGQGEGQGQTVSAEVTEQGEEPSRWVLSLTGFLNVLHFIEVNSPEFLVFIFAQTSVTNVDPNQLVSLI